uniref:NADH-ubiquinone oxidoreductase chain 6 n=1 Tax=Xiphophorus couchianus TaxID=32473 RepID=A0A3B5KTC9_9TELE
YCFTLLLGLVAVASNPSPYFAALGLVVVAGVGCGVLVGSGGCFLSLILFLIYLGGMLVVFAYSAAMAAEPFPEGWGNPPPCHFSGHSFRIGVATSPSSGVPSASLLQLGRWSSPAFSSYILPNLSAVLEAPHAMSAGEHLSKLLVVEP